MPRALHLILLCACSGPEPSTEPLPIDSAPPTPIVDDTGSGGFCAVQTVLSGECLLCHSAATALGGLDLQTDPYAALVGVASSATGAPLVAPGDPDGSLLVRKLEGSQAPGEGDAMPPSGLLDPASQATVRAWVAAGAPEGCGTEPTGPTVPLRHHPEGYDAPAVHGMDTKLRVDRCADCHGEALDGGTLGVSCAECHEQTVADWTTSCTFCHGDRATDNPAPPQDIDDNPDPDTISFPLHTVHVLGDAEDPVHAGWDCVECHRKPTDVFTEGHVLEADNTVGVAEVDFGSPGARSPNAVYTPGIGCGNVWCHGTGQDGGEGAIDFADTVVCGGCHPVATHRDEMSGDHLVHLQAGQGCPDCHTTAATDPYRIIDFDLHINGQRDVTLPAGIVWQSASTCDGSCHGEAHTAEPW